MTALPRRVRARRARDAARRAQARADGLGAGHRRRRRARAAGGLFPDLDGQTSWAACCPTPPCASPTRWTTGTAWGSSSALACRCCCAARRRSSPAWRGARSPPCRSSSSVIYLTSSRGAAAVGAAGALVLLAFSARRLLTLRAAAVGGAGAGAAISSSTRGDALVEGPLHSSTGHSPGPQRGTAGARAVRGDGGRGPWRALPRRGAPGRRAASGSQLWPAALAGGAAVLVAGPRKRVDEFKKPPPADSFPGSRPRATPRRT